MQYDPKLMTVLVNGDVITGYSDDSKIGIQRNNDDVSPATGIQGDTVFNLNGNRSGTITFSLFAGSASITRLRSLANSRATVSCTVRNANSDGGFTVSATDCRILKTPGFSGGATTDSIEVSIYVPTLDFK